MAAAARIPDANFTLVSDDLDSGGIDPSVSIRTLFNGATVSGLKSAPTPWATLSAESFGDVCLGCAKETAG
jgi:hypothetical protein